MPFITQKKLTSLGIGFSQNVDLTEFNKMVTLTEGLRVRPVLYNIYEDALGWADNADPIKSDLYDLASKFSCYCFMIRAVSAFGSSSLTGSGLKTVDDDTAKKPSEVDTNTIISGYDLLSVTAENELRAYLANNRTALGYTGQAYFYTSPSFGFSGVTGTRNRENS